MIIGPPQSPSFEIQKPSDIAQPPLNFGIPSRLPNWTKSIAVRQLSYQIDWFKKQNGNFIVAFNYGSIVTVECDLTKTPVEYSTLYVMNENVKFRIFGVKILPSSTEDDKYFLVTT